LLSLNFKIRLIKEGESTDLVKDQPRFLSVASQWNVGKAGKINEWFASIDSPDK
jgi:hypothetical protein